MAKKRASLKDTYTRKMPDGSTQTRGFNPVPLQQSRVARDLHAAQGWVKAGGSPVGVAKPKAKKQEEEPETV